MKITKYKTMMEYEKIPCLVKESSQNYECANSTFECPKEIVDMIKKVYELHNATEEYLYLLAFDTKQHLIGVFEISHGTVNQSIAQPREIFMKSLLCGAVTISLIHNHPSGVVAPSKEDTIFTQRVLEAGKLVGIALIDSIIIGNGYFSFKEQSLLT